MNRYFIPRLAWSDLRAMAGWVSSGALVAGSYGVLHDQITFTISPEYFTRMKFDQFRAADFGFPDRIFVAEIGFLATWWVGLLATWFLARAAIARGHRGSLRTIMPRAWALMFGLAGLVGIIGRFVGPSLYGGSAWVEALDAMGVTDSHAFGQVAGIHVGGYLGALAGWLWAFWRIGKLRRENQIDRP